MELTERKLLEEQMQLTALIHELEASLETNADQLRKSAGEWAWNAIQIGRELLKMRNRLHQHKRWCGWVENNLKSSLRQCQRFMAMSTAWEMANESDREKLLGAGSIQEFLQLANRPADSVQQDLPTLSRAPYLDAIYRGSRFVKFMADQDVTSWPDAGKDKLRDDLLPTVRKLWPDRF